MSDTVQVDDTRGYFFEELEIGMASSAAKVITEPDINAFAELSGDFNPVHVNQNYAAKTMFKGRIAHGMHTAAFISAVLGTKLPGPGAIYVTQSLKFMAPVRIGDEVLATVTLTRTNPEKRRAYFTCNCTVGETVVLTGEAELLVPAKP